MGNTAVGSSPNRNDSPRPSVRWASTVVPQTAATRSVSSLTAAAAIATPLLYHPNRARRLKTRLFSRFRELAHEAAVAEIARAKLCANASQKVDDLRVLQTPLDFKLPEPKHTCPTFEHFGFHCAPWHSRPGIS